MKIVYLKSVDAISEKKISKKQAQHLRCIAMIAKQRDQDRKAAELKFAERIEVIKAFKDVN